jgi:hypothetical protein
MPAVVAFAVALAAAVALAVAVALALALALAFLSVIPGGNLLLPLPQARAKGPLHISLVSSIPKRKVVFAFRRERPHPAEAGEFA